MTAPTTIKIDDAEYIRKDSIQPEASSDIRIVVLQRGWVAIGEYYQDGAECTLTNAKIIRQWGTTKGLGELATGGPTSKTVLDPCPTLRFNEFTVVMTIDCVKEKWGA